MKPCSYCGGTVDAKHTTFIDRSGVEIVGCPRHPEDTTFTQIVDKEIELNLPQPPPKGSAYPRVWDLTVIDMYARDAEGVRKYGMPLRAHNGRDALIDAYQEALDLAVYLRQAIYERDGK